MVDVLMLPLVTAEKMLTAAGIPFVVAKSAPRSNKFQLLDDCQYVVRQTMQNGVCHLVVAAKMGKEVQ
ncbi:MAG: hypothetical protein KAZ05_05060 [Negativicutes bacterium]|nr:hypothetical protein [Negativicutes bacterium]